MTNNNKNEPFVTRSPDKLDESDPYARHKTCKVEGVLDVCKRLELLKQWEKEWRDEDNKLIMMVRELDESDKSQLETGVQIANLRKRIKMWIVREPLELDEVSIREYGFNILREKLVLQFASLTPLQRKNWLNNFYFMMTPDLRDLNDKFSNVLSFRSLGQDRNFVLSGHSGMGKTTYLNWLASNYIPVVLETHNEITLVKIDAPVSNTSPKPLYKRILLECGRHDLEDYDQEDLLNKIVVAFMKCGVKIVIVDEVEHIRRSALRRRLLEISNMTEGIGFVCASVNARAWTAGDSEVQGRWNDGFRLKRYTGNRLAALLTMIELFLPFSQSSHLNKFEIRTGTKKLDAIAGPAKIIEECTGGILRDIMILIMDSSIKAIDQKEPCISPTILENSWKNIQTNSDRDYMKLLTKAKEE